MLAYTPEVAWPEPCTLVMGVQASLSLFGGPRSLCRRIRRHIKQCFPDLQIRMAMAPSARGAMILAAFQHTGPLRILKSSTLARQLARLPLQTLPAAQAFMTWLQSLGCTTLGQLNALARTGLKQRTHPELLVQLDQAYGRLSLPLSWFTNTPAFELKLPLTYAVEHAGALQAVARGTLDQACQWLNQHQLACHTLQFRLYHESGRHARPATLLHITRANPGWLPADFLPLLEQRLHTLCLEQPVVALGIGIAQTQQRQACSGQLFPDAAEQRRLEEHVLDLIRTRLGGETVRFPHPVAEYLPEYANQWACNNAAASAVPGQARVAGLVRTDLPPHSRPAWLFNPPVPLETRHNRPVYAGQQLRLLHGPERLESRWWSHGGHQQRDYFIALAGNGVRYWVYRQRDTLQPLWFLHGQFG